MIDGVLPLGLALFASATPVVVVADGDGRPFLQAIEAVRQQAAAVQVLSVEQAPAALERRRGTSPWIALGPRAARLVASSTTSGTAAALLLSHQLPHGMLGVPLDSPLALQVRRLRTAFPGRHQLILLWGENGISPETLASVVHAAGFRLLARKLARPGDAVAELTDLLGEDARRSVVWLLPDAGVVTPDTVGPLVQTALAFRAPIVGFSDYFSRLGAVGAVHHDFADIGRKALVLARGLPLPAPARTKLVINGRLAARLGIVVSSGPGVEVTR